MRFGFNAGAGVTSSAGVQTLHVEDGHRLRKTLQHEGTDIHQCSHFLNCRSDAAGDEDLAVFGFPTKPRGEVAYRADRRVAGAVGESNSAERSIASAGDRSEGVKSRGLD